jgi:DNA-directed RNA polymerase alpha subunit
MGIFDRVREAVRPNTTETAQAHQPVEPPLYWDWDVLSPRVLADLPITDKRLHLSTAAKFALIEANILYVAELVGVRPSDTGELSKRARTLNYAEARFPELGRLATYSRIRCAREKVRCPSREVRSALWLLRQAGFTWQFCREFGMQHLYGRGLERTRLLNAPPSYFDRKLRFDGAAFDRFDDALAALGLARDMGPTDFGKLLSPPREWPSGCGVDASCGARLRHLIGRFNLHYDFAAEGLPWNLGRREGLYGHDIKDQLEHVRFDLQLCWPEITDHIRVSALFALANAGLTIKETFDAPPPVVPLSRPRGDANDPVLGRSLFGLGFPALVFDVAVRQGARTLGDLARLDKAAFSAMPGLGSVQISQTKTIFARFGLEFGMTGATMISQTAPALLAYNDRLRLKLSDMGLSVRLQNAFIDAEIVTIADLVGHKPADLLRLDQLGAIALQEVEALLAALDLTLGMKPEIITALEDGSCATPEEARALLFPEPTALGVPDQKTVKTMLNSAIADYELSVRSRNVLRAEEIRTWADLVVMTEAELLRYSNFGRKSLNEIKEELTKMGLTLAMNSETVTALVDGGTTLPVPSAIPDFAAAMALLDPARLSAGGSGLAIAELYRLWHPEPLLADNCQTADADSGERGASW